MKNQLLQKVFFKLALQASEFDNFKKKKKKRSIENFKEKRIDLRMNFVQQERKKLHYFVKKQKSINPSIHPSIVRSFICPLVVVGDFSRSRHQNDYKKKAKKLSSQQTMSTES